MKRFVLSTRVQRAVKIEKILNEMTASDWRGKACRCIKNTETPKLLKKLSDAMEKCINNNIMYNNKDIYQALVHKVRFKFVSKKCLSDIIITLERVVHEIGACIEIDAEMAEVKLNLSNISLLYNCTP